MSLEAKAALIGAMYALERLFATSGQAGTNLTNFNATLGVSAQALQQYQFAARQAGVSNQETEATFKSLQSAMTKTLMGEGAPKGLARVSMFTGNMTAQDLKKFAEQPQLLIQKLQEYAQKETNAGLRNEVLKSFGVGESMIAALQRKAFRPEVLQKAPAYSDKEIQSLDRANIGWSNLGNKIEMSIGHFNAAHGGELVKDITKLVDPVLKLAGAFEKLSQSAHVFEIIGMSIKGWIEILQGLTSTVEKIMGAVEDPKKAKTLGEDTKSFFKEIPGTLGVMWDELTTPGDKAVPVTPKKNANQTATPAQHFAGGGLLGKANPFYVGDKDKKEPKKEPEDTKDHSMAAIAKHFVETARGKGFADGGPTGHDTVPALIGGKDPAWFDPREYVLNPQQVGQIGVNALETWRKDGKMPNQLAGTWMGNPKNPRFALGGPTMGEVIRPPMPGISTGGSSQSIEVNQNLNFAHEGKDAAQTGDSVRKSIKDAFRQISAQAQGS